MRGLLPPLPQGRLPPSPHGRNSYPSLTMIRIFPLLCEQFRAVTARRALRPLTCPPSLLMLSPPKLSLRFVEIRSFSLSSSSLSLRSKSQSFIPRTTNGPHPIKIRLFQLLCIPHLNKLKKLIRHEMHPGLRTEVQKGAFLHRVFTTTSCHQDQNYRPSSELQ